MNARELLKFIFDGIEGDVTIFDASTDEELDIDPSGDAYESVLFENPYVALVVGDVVAGVIVDDPKLGTFSIETDSGSVHVALFEEPVSLDDIPQYVDTDIPLPLDDHRWFSEGTDTFYLFAEVFNEKDLVETPIEDRGHTESDSSEEGEEVSEEAPTQINDAQILGKDCPEMQALLNKSATLLTGEVWGLKDRRNTLDGDWNQVELTWADWIAGEPKRGTKSAWGFSRHPAGKHKEGACVVLGSSVDGARMARAMDLMWAVGLDIDSGADLDDVLALLEEKGIFSLVYTSFNHGKRGLEIKRDDVLKKLQISGDPTLPQIQQYLLEHSKSRYETDFVANVTIREQKKQTKKGVVIVLDTPPLHKFRILCPLSEPVKLINLAPSQEESLKIWEDKITGLAQNELGLHFDTSCTDPSRLFYTARHPKDAEDWYCAVVQGKPLNFDDIKPMKKAAYTSKREVNPFTEAAGETDHDRPPSCYTPAGNSLNAWHYKAKERFLIADLLDDVCSDRVRVSGGESQGHVHTECPFESEHSEEGGTACMAVNSIDSQNEYWTWFCHHDSCQGRHKLEFLEKALQDGWFEESLLIDDAYLLPADDEDEDEEKEEEEKGPVERAAEFTDDSSEQEIREFMESLNAEGADLTVRSRVNEKLAEVTSLGKMDVKRIWREIDSAAHKKEQADNMENLIRQEGAAVVGVWDFDKQCEYAQERVKQANRKKPHIFHYMDNLCVIRENSEGRAKMKFLDKDGWRHQMNTHTRFVKLMGEGKSELVVSAPDDVVTHLFSADYENYPRLRGVVTTPIFTHDGNLLVKEGYDYSSKLYYKPDASLVVPKIPKNPSQEDMEEAKRLLVEEVLADFPLGGRERPEIVEECLRGDGIASVTNMVSLILLPFVREMVIGPTPGHLLTKPSPGTGASLLTDVFSIIASGTVTPAMAMPTSKDEMSKTLTSVLANGQGIVFFDNINHSVDSGELASAMTAPTYQARILGKTQTVEVDVRCAWVFTGNNVTLSSELIRRLIMIDLNTSMANPELRTGFRHADIRGWTTENRSRLVWACLTLIQSWITAGSPRSNEEILASYENWSSVMGGLLKHVGFGQFLKNRSELKSKAEDSDDDDILLFVQEWWGKLGSTPTPVRAKDNEMSLISLAVMEDLQLPIRSKRNADGDMTYDARTFGKFLSKYTDKVTKLEDGTEVKIAKIEGKRSSSGQLWQLVVNKKKINGNVE